MKIPLLCGLVGLAISFALPAFAQQKDTADPQIAEQIRMLAVKFDEAFNKHDPAAIAELYTEDGVNVFNGTAHGRQAIEKSYAQDFQSWQSNNHFTKIDRLIAVGNEVRATGRCSDSPQDAHGVRRNNEGYYSWIIVREGDTWKIRRSTLSETNWPSILPACSSRGSNRLQIGPAASGKSIALARVPDKSLSVWYLAARHDIASSA